MPAARNQLVQVRRRSVVKSKPQNTKGNRSHNRRSTMLCKRAIQVDKTIGIVHDVIAGPPCRCSVVTTSRREVRLFVYPSRAAQITQDVGKCRYFMKKDDPEK